MNGATALELAADAIMAAMSSYGADLPQDTSMRSSFDNGFMCGMTCAVDALRGCAMKLHPEGPETGCENYFAIPEKNT